ncbi:MAG TPA: C69 family dipeptidase [Spirochaetota bacterium]|nr:C69 family dipeptidase [Spirochaetota bacterium]
MCDTIVATQKATADGSVILAKNSDREANEAQLLKYIAKRSWGNDTTVQCTYTSIPQVKETNEIFISKPFWMWGCEMGANAHGLAIGNEAVFTKEPYEKTGLLGMDLIRLSLERCKNAYDALMLTTEFIEKYGQGGNAGMAHKLFYHNSFIFADSSCAYVLETANKHWVAIKVDGIRSISNGLTIEEEFTFASKGIEDYALKKGYLKKGDTFNFKKCFSDTLYTFFSRCSDRQSRTTACANKNSGTITPQSMFALLRDHGNDDMQLPPDKTSMSSVCMHASLLPTRPSQSVAAFVAHLRDNIPAFWATGSSGTCTSVFMPFYLIGKDIDYFPAKETSTYSPENYWWIHEKIHRQAIFKWDYFQKTIAPSITSVENEFMMKENELIKKMNTTTQKYFDFSKLCVEKVLMLNEKWEKELKSAPYSNTKLSFTLFWNSQTKKAMIPL